VNNVAVQRGVMLGGTGAISISPIIIARSTRNVDIVQYEWTGARGTATNMQRYIFHNVGIELQPTTVSNISSFVRISGTSASDNQPLLRWEIQSYL